MQTFAAILEKNAPKVTFDSCFAFQVSEKNEFEKNTPQFMGVGWGVGVREVCMLQET